MNEEAKVHMEYAMGIGYNTIKLSSHEYLSLYTI